jgi:hypothetical protein
MSRVDTAWLRMERATNLMMITSVMMFEEQMSLEQLKKLVKTRFLAYPRFRQRTVDTAAGAFWEEDADFDLDWHVRLSALPGRGGKRELERFVSQQASTPLNKIQAAVAVPPRGEVPRRRLGAGHAHPPLLRRRHGAGAGDAVDDRHRARGAPPFGDRQGLAGEGEDKSRANPIDRYMKMGSQVLEKGLDIYRDPTWPR